jgi:cysteine-rich repeat protein
LEKTQGENLPNVPVTVLAPSTCGDGIIEGCEACDDGGTTPGDGCDATAAKSRPAPGMAHPLAIPGPSCSAV